MITVRHCWWCGFAAEVDTERPEPHNGLVRDTDTSWICTDNGGCTRRALDGCFAHSTPKSLRRCKCCRFPHQSLICPNCKRRPGNFPAQSTYVHYLIVDPQTGHTKLQSTTDADSCPLHLKPVTWANYPEHLPVRSIRLPEPVSRYYP